mmetsp:Transcript_83016/g.177935  ORF Transcript_83016/g.177935 Transcript_83016/m.177935 type:complete len:85 (+) Transcript_83016:84-338(+)
MSAAFVQPVQQMEYAVVGQVVHPPVTISPEDFAALMRGEQINIEKYIEGGVAPMPETTAAATTAKKSSKKKTKVSKKKSKKGCC